MNKAKSEVKLNFGYNFLFACFWLTYCFYFYSPEFATWIFFTFGLFMSFIGIGCCMCLAIPIRQFVEDAKTQKIQLSKSRRSNYSFSQKVYIYINIFAIVAIGYKIDNKILFGCAGFCLAGYFLADIKFYFIQKKILKLTD